MINRRQEISFSPEVQVLSEIHDYVRCVFEERLKNEFHDTEFHDIYDVSIFALLGRIPNGSILTLMLNDVLSLSMPASLIQEQLIEDSTRIVQDKEIPFPTEKNIPSEE